MSCAAGSGVNSRSQRLAGNAGGDGQAGAVPQPSCEVEARHRAALRGQHLPEDGDVPAQPLLRVALGEASTGPGDEMQGWCKGWRKRLAQTRRAQSAPSVGGMEGRLTATSVHPREQGAWCLQNHMGKAKGTGTRGEKPGPASAWQGAAPGDEGSFPSAVLHLLCAASPRDALGPWLHRG